MKWLLNLGLFVFRIVCPIQITIGGNHPLSQGGVEVLKKLSGFSTRLSKILYIVPSVRDFKVQKTHAGLPIKGEYI